MSVPNSKNLKLEQIINRDDLRNSLAIISENHAADSSDARSAVLNTLKEFNKNGRIQAREMLFDDGSGDRCTRRISHLQDTLLQELYSYVISTVYQANNPSTSERLAISAVGGYGRGKLAPGSDIDLLFILPYKQTPWTEQVVEYILYILWDMGLKVGHATRNIDECLLLSTQDMTIRTSILDSRLICGDKPLLNELTLRFRNEVVENTAHEFIEAKLEERDLRHLKIGDTRFLVEPNIKEGKGGLRDLQTLYWLTKYHYGIKRSRDLVKRGVLSKKEYNIFYKAEDFLWAVRCHMHFLTGKAVERLSFDIQQEIANNLGYKDHPGLSGVERFMKHYFLVAKDVGNLTRILSAILENEEAKQTPGFANVLRRLTHRIKKIPGTNDFVLDGGRISVSDDEVFKRDPVNIIRLFSFAQERELFFHPNALQLVTRSLKLITAKLRKDKEANRIFLEILTSNKKPALFLRRMNESGVLGRFIPDFGKIVSMMQFNMYHHFTVDEHLLRTVEVLSEIDSGKEEGKHPLATLIFPEIKDRVVLYVAVLLHDVAKGRPEDHSVAGAKVARTICPKFGLSPKQTELVAWLIEEHLTMSMIAQTRDLNDRKTIEDFAAKVQSTERLKLLLVLTVCDIRGVGPGVWNGWKGQLLRTLYYETELLLSGGFSKSSRKERADAARARLVQLLNHWDDGERKNYSSLHYDPYLLTVCLEDQLRHAEFIRRADQAEKALATMVRTHSFHAITEITILTPDHPKLLSIIAGACSAANANIVDAQIFTTSDGRALDTILINREFENESDEIRRAENVSKLIEDVLSGQRKLPEMIKKRARKISKTKAFTVEPKVQITNSLSNIFTVIEVEGLDRSGILSELTAVIADLSLNIASAHITTFGEKIIDTFYVSDLLGHKITQENRITYISERLVAIISGIDEEIRNKMPSGMIAQTKKSIKNKPHKPRRNSKPK